MGLNLIMKRRVFAVIQKLAVEYEDKFGKRKGLTPLITNQLLAEALITRGLLSADFLKAEYGSPDPLKEGFSYRGYRSEQARQKRSEKNLQQEQSEGWSKRFRDVAAQWDNLSERSKEYHVKKARELVDKVPEAQKILDKSEARARALQSSKDSCSSHSSV